MMETAAVTPSVPQPGGFGKEALAANSDGPPLASDSNDVFTPTVTEFQTAAVGVALHDGLARALGVASGRSSADRGAEGQPTGLAGQPEATAQRSDAPSADRRDNGLASRPPESAAASRADRTERTGLTVGQLDLGVCYPLAAGRWAEASASPAEQMPCGVEVPGPGWEPAPHQQAGLLGDASLAEESSLNAAIRQFFLQLDEVGRDLGQTLARNKFLPWLLAGVMGALAVEATRQYLRRARLRTGTAAGEDEDEDTLTWVPGLPDPVAVEVS
jgi:hypothetical protein